MVLPCELDEAGSLDLLGEPAALREWDDRVLGRVHDERRDVDRRRDVPDIELAAEPHERDCRGGGSSSSVGGTDPLHQRHVVLLARREPDALWLSPPDLAGEDLLEVSVVLLARFLSQRPVVLEDFLHLTANEDERSRPVGMSRREHHRQGGALAYSHEDGAL